MVCIDRPRGGDAARAVSVTRFCRPDTIAFVRRWIVFVAVAGLLGCGGQSGSDDSSASAVPDLRHVRCLDRAGVTFAHDMRDLDFFIASVNRDEDEKPAVAFVEDYSIAVDYWNKVGAAGTPPSAPPEWVLLQAQPTGQDKTVADIVKERPPSSYVAYIRDPSEQQLDLIDRCLTPTRAEIERARGRSK